MRIPKRRGPYNHSEYLTHVITQDYQTILGRAPDAGELNAAIAFLRGGGTNAQFQSLLYGSQEYFNAHGGTNSGFLTALFQGVTGQGLDTGTPGTLTNPLNGGFSRGQLAQLLLATPAASQQQITNYFQQFLGRTPNAAELNAFGSLAQNGQTNLDLAIILASQEFANRFSGTGTGI